VRSEKFSYLCQKEKKEKFLQKNKVEKKNIIRSKIKQKVNKTKKKS
jgi:hypothetical protein